MPDPQSLPRLVALIVFIALVAVGLWLLDAAWWVVPPVMVGALLTAWTIEWFAWRGSLPAGVGSETEVGSATPPPLPAEDVAPSESLPPLVVSAPPAPHAAEPEPTPAPEPAVRDHEPEPAAPPDVAPSHPPAPQPAPEPPPPAEEQPAPVAGEPTTAEQAEVEQPPPSPPPAPRRPRRFRLRSVPPARPEPAPAPEPSPSAAPAVDASPVVELRPRATQPREWNLWDLERIAREEAGEHPERRDEWAYLFLNLRQFARADGSLPAEFDPLVRESFGGLLERPHGA